MNDPLTAANIRKMVAKLKEVQIAHRTFTSQKECDAVNEVEKSIGLHGNWKVGDAYYNLKDLIRAGEMG